MGLSGNQWALGANQIVTMENSCDWSKVDGAESHVYAVTGAYRCIDFKKKLWFDMGKRM